MRVDPETAIKLVQEFSSVNNLNKYREAYFHTSKLQKVHRANKRVGSRAGQKYVPGQTEANPYTFPYQEGSIRSPRLEVEALQLSPANKQP